VLASFAVEHDIFGDDHSLESFLEYFFVCSMLCAAVQDFHVAFG
jgi:hypothetical protein